MKWNRYTLTTTTQAVDLVSYALSEMGIEGIEIEDKIPLTQQEKEQMFIDILPELPPDDGLATVHFYVDQEEDHEDTVIRVLEALEALKGMVDVGPAVITRSETEDVDWINNWKQYWKPFYPTPGILIKPTWEPMPETQPGTMVVELDPGTSFGTGTHHTTRLVIEALTRYVKPGMHLLDVGCGSGILSIIGMKLGAADVTATDVDPAAVKATGENTAVNGIDADRCRILSGNVLSDPAFREQVGVHAFDIAAANILADVIIPLCGVVRGMIRENGLFISSGIIDTKAEAVAAALRENGFEILEKTVSGEWVCYTARCGKCPDSL